uniref:Uncharacterized protein n=1 Tax=Lepeophtheirus salmonis TaxID=72036 RepID=A0A0K2TR84_LEPSM
MQKVRLRLFVWHPYIEILLKAILIQMVQNCFLANFQFLNNEFNCSHAGPTRQFLLFYPNF